MADFDNKYHIYSDAVIHGDTEIGGDAKIANGIVQITGDTNIGNKVRIVGNTDITGNLRVDNLSVVEKITGTLDATYLTSKNPITIDTDSMSDDDKNTHLTYSRFFNGIYSRRKDTGLINEYSGLFEGKPVKITDGLILDGNSQLQGNLNPSEANIVGDIVVNDVIPRGEYNSKDYSNIEISKTVTTKAYTRVHEDRTKGVETGAIHKIYGKGENAARPTPNYF